MQENKTEEKTLAQETVNESVSDKKGKEVKEKKPLGREILEWVLSILAAVVIAMVIRTFIFEPIRVDGASMNDTLVDGEVMFVSKLGYCSFDFFDGRHAAFGDPKRFDVVICRYPNRGSTNFVKRVIGIPGDKVAVIDGYVYVNGEKYEEPYINDEYRVGHGSYFPETEVPAGQYFVMGDHRNNSNDSRYIGPIDRNMIMGRVTQVLFPFNAFRAIPNGLEVE